MTIRTCPACDATYVATVDRCPDCDVLLVDPPDDETLAELSSEDQIAYELHEWANQSKVALDGMLNQQGIAHVWEAGTLVIRAADEDQVDELVEGIEVTEQPTLDPDADQVVYDLEGFDDGMRANLEAALMADEIAHGWDEERNLVVLEVDEERVEPILDRIDGQDDLTADEVAADGDDGDGDGEPQADDDELIAQDLMSAMFVAADKLMKDAADADEAAALGAAREQASKLPVPYGFTPALWSSIVDRAEALQALLDADDIDEPATKQAARELRETLHQYV
jgi:hypothetical protein